ncbi:HlyD family efflux transporter periplasmic adaptor subunit [uncultured Deinococcus sp.]|uniref:efflux RND transporter periplasmic adaptor subunit n=1 Tax=uncultured Deinococcus sp. TaxID=158789 RepID=UPI0025872253|nr:HlyD family efflux transporter periplasmic adaptor subunit [uncultured Deinococcus sp.]
MSQASSPHPPQEGPPTDRTPVDRSAAGQSPPRRGLLRWILVPLLLAGGGFVGYRLGQDDSGSSGAGSGFGAGQGGFGAQGSAGQGAAGQGGAGRAGGSGATGAGATATGATGQAGAGQGTRSQPGQGQAGTGTGAGTGAGQTGAQSGTGGRAGAGQGTGTRTGSGIVTPVQAAAVKSGTLSAQRRLSGTVAAAQSGTVTARTSGTVTEVLAGVGSALGAGDTALRLSSPDLQSSVQSAQNALDSAQLSLRSQASQTAAGRASLEQAVTAAQTSLDNARRSLASLQRLYEVGAVARTEVDAQNVQVQNARSSLVAAQSNLAANARSGTEGQETARLAVQKAQITLNQAQAAAAAARVTVPFAGQVTALNVSAGQYVSAGTEVLTLVSRDQQVRVNVPPTEAASLPVGTALNFVAGQRTYPVKVSQNAGSAGTGSVPVVARFTGESRPAAGTVGTVVYDARVATGVLVPSTALQADSEQTYLFTVENGRAVQHTVTVLGQAGTQSAVSGVAAGAQVISQPPTGLLDGGAVRTAAAGSQSGGGQGGPPPGGPGGAP